nr:MAG TPA: hypothetical protein [Caudoviricetes sp.]
MEAIGLNPIRLDAIGIDPIRLNAIRLGVPGASSGSARPYIDPDVLASLVAVCICDGKSNNDPDRAIIKNLVDPDNPFVISNAAYKLNSGFGKYEEDFTQSSIWKLYKGVNVTPDKISLNSNFVPNNYWIIYKVIDTLLNDFKVKISGIPDGGVLEYYTGGLLPNIKLKNGDNKLEFNGLTSISSTGFRIYSGSSLDWSKLVIEQIPSFQGALVTDGVNDLITSSKTVQEMLGGSTEITVVSMIANLDSQQIMCNSNYSGFQAYNIRNTLEPNGVTSILGFTDKNGITNNLNLIMGDKNSIKLVDNVNFNSTYKFLPAQYNGAYYQVAWYWTFIAKRALTTDEINQVIAYFNLDKHVKPDIYYDVKRQGLSNNTPDADWYLKDFSGNGRDMQLYNYGKTPESGINEEGGLQSDGVTDCGQYVGDLGLKDYTVAVDRTYPSLKGNGVPIISGIKSDTATPFLFEFADNTGVVRPYSFGATTVLSPMELNRKISYQSTYIYDGTTIIKGIQSNAGSGLTIGRFGEDRQYANIALWSLLLFPYSLSEFLLERQLKRYKLGTLYPDMVEFRPIVKSNSEYQVIDYYIDNLPAVVGKYYPIDSNLRIAVVTKGVVDEVSCLIINGVSFGTPNVVNNRFTFNGTLSSKSPQKIDITIDEYIRYEDIDLPAAYPFIPVLQGVSWGDKLKVGDTIIFSRWSNLLPDLYRRTGEMILNGKPIISNTPVTVEKVMKFEMSRTYLKDNEPNCILSPQTLRIPNASYKILGYIPDLTGKGNHGKINNSAYAGMSGANGYPVDWNSWYKNNVVIVTDSKITLEKNINSLTYFCYTNQSSIPGYKVNISGIPDDGNLNYGGNRLHNGINELVGKDGNTGTFGFRFDSISDWSNLVIQQIGEYEGSFCLDGVDDFITIPTLASGAKQVLMKVNTQNMNGVLYDQRKSFGSPWYFAVYNTTEADSVAYAARNTNGKTYIDGVLNANITCQQLLNITHNLTVTNNGANEQNTQSPVIGDGRSAAANFSKMALFTFMSFNDISSEDEIKELNDIVGIEGGYVESPDYYFDAYGKSNNLDEDIDLKELGLNNARSMILDKSIEGLEAIEHYKNTGSVVNLALRRLSLNNFAFNEESGYVDNGLVSDGVDDNLKNTSMPVLTDYTWIMKRKRLNDKSSTTLCYKGAGGTNGAFLFEFIEGGNGTRNFGNTNAGITFPDLISWQTKSSYNGKDITVGSATDGNALHIFMGSNSYPYYTKAVFYKAMLYSKTIDQLSINMLKNLFAKDELIDVNNPIFKK